MSFLFSFKIHATGKVKGGKLIFVSAGFDVIVNLLIDSLAFGATAVFEQALPD